MEAPNLPLHYTLVENPGPDLLDQVYCLRVLAWRSQARLKAGVVRWIDRFDLSAKHWVIVFEDRAVAAIRLSLHNRVADLPSAAALTGVFPEDVTPPIASYNRLVVHPSHRGRGLAKVLDIVCIKAADAARASVLVGLTGNVHGNESRIAAMKALGFVVIGLAATADVDIIEDEGRSTVLAHFYRQREYGQHQSNRSRAAQNSG